MGTEKKYDLSYLNEISGGDKDFILDMITDFVNNTPTVLAEVAKNINSNDWQNLYKAVHKFIPSFEFVGAEKVREALVKIEDYSKTQTNLNEIPYFYEQVKEYCNEVIVELKQDYNL